MTPNVTQNCLNALFLWRQKNLFREDALTGVAGLVVMDTVLGALGAFHRYLIEPARFRLITCLFDCLV